MVTRRNEDRFRPTEPQRRRTRRLRRLDRQRRRRPPVPADPPRRTGPPKQHAELAAPPPLTRRSPRLPRRRTRSRARVPFLSGSRLAQLLGPPRQRRAGLWERRLRFADNAVVVSPGSGVASSAWGSASPTRRASSTETRRPAGSAPPSRADRLPTTSRLAARARQRGWRSSALRSARPLRWRFRFEDFSCGPAALRLTSLISVLHAAPTA